MRSNHSTAYAVDSVDRAAKRTARIQSKQGRFSYREAPTVSSFADNRPNIVDIIAKGGFALFWQYVAYNRPAPPTRIAF